MTRDAVLEVVEVGPVTTVQDRGRPGMMRFGVPASGPMDRRAFAVALAALDAPADRPAIEVSVGGLVLRCLSGGVTVAVAGGGFRVDADGAVTPSWTLRRLEAGSVLAIRPGPWGSWTYLGFAGRLDSTAWLGSTATHLVSGRGGGALAAGQRLVVRDALVLPGGRSTIPFPATARPRPRVRVVIGPQDRYFATETVDVLLSARFSLTSAYDRMGVRLAGPSLKPFAALTMPSEPILRGSIQVAGDGVASVLLADHQTTGGYPKIATIVAEDTDGFAQLRSRDAVTFERVAPEAAVEIARTRHATLERFLEALRTSRRSAQTNEAPQPGLQEPA